MQALSFTNSPIMPVSMLEYLNDANDLHYSTNYNIKSKDNKLYYLIRMVKC